MFFISLEELERVKRINGLRTAVDLAARTNLSRNTWNEAIKTRRPTPRVLNALADLGASPERVLIKLTDEDLNPAA